MLSLQNSYQLKICSMTMPLVWCVTKEDFSVLKVLPRVQYFLKVELEVQVLLSVLRGREVSKSHEEKKE